MRSHEFHATPTAAPVPAPLSHAVTLHHAHHAAVAMARLWRQHARRGAAGAQRVLVWKEAAGGPTACAPASVTACARIDLDLHGPWLLDLPDGAWGLLDDGWLRPVGRLNAVGDPHRRYLLVGPAQDVAAPADATVLRSATRGAWLTLRLDADGDDALRLSDGQGAPAGAALARLAALRLRPQSPAARRVPLAFVERLAQRRPWPGLADARFFAELARLAALESYAGLSANAIDDLAQIGIRPGRPFAPDDALRALLGAAAARAMGAARAARSDSPLRAPAQAHAMRLAPAAAAVPMQRWQRAFAGLGAGDGQER